MPTLQIYAREELYNGLSKLADPKKGETVKQVAIWILEDYLRAPRLEARWAQLKRVRPTLDAR